MEKRRSTYFDLMTILVIGIFTTIPENTQAANILGLFPISGMSHNNAFTALTKELAARGHHLTVVTPHPLKSVVPENYEQIDVSKAILKHFTGFDKVNVIGFIEIFSKLHNITTTCCRETLKLPEIQRLMDPKKSGKQFDLLLISHFYSDCFLGFSHVYNIPIVMMSPGGTFPNTDELVANVALPSYVPTAFLPFTDRMTFKQRTINILASIFLKGFNNFILYPSQEKILKEFFGKDVPSMAELQSQISVILLNNHFTYNYPRPSVPAIIEVGGLHVKAPKPLPKELKNFMDGAKSGVIYFSMGSNVKSINFPENIRDEILSAFSELKQTVLWKWEGETAIRGKPDNVRLEKWLPQTDLLAHPNMKIFITHGGLLSFQEAVDRGVPVIGIPMFGDQDLNMEKVVNLGVGIKVPYKELTGDSLLKAIKEILNNSSYHIKMKELSTRVKDQPQTPLERAVYWTEYVIRHKGAKHLSSPGLDLAWYQLYMFDVMIILQVAQHFIPFYLFYALYKLIRLCCGSRNLLKKADTIKPKMS